MTNLNFLRMYRAALILVDVFFVFLLVNPHLFNITYSWLDVILNILTLPLVMIQAILIIIGMVKIKFIFTSKITFILLVISTLLLVYEVLSFFL